MNAYKPRRCSARWLDADCPRGVLAIMDYGPNEPAERYDVFYAEPITDDSWSWMQFISLDADGRYSHGEMEAYKLAEYRYRRKHRYTRWSDLPAKVQAVVRKDLEEMA